MTNRDILATYSAEPTNGCGIYAIYCIADDKLYIGSSKNIKRRWTRHRAELANNRHCNIHLQRAWTKYGKHLFTFHVLEHCLLEHQYDREAFFVSLVDRKNCFNVASIKSQILGNRSWNSGKSLPEETKEKMRQSNKRHFLGKTHSEETKRKMRKLTDTQIKEIRKSPMKSQELALLYKVSPRTIRHWKSSKENNGEVRCYKELSI